MRKKPVRIPCNTTVDLQPNRAELHTTYMQQRDWSCQCADIVYFNSIRVPLIDCTKNILTLVWSPSASLSPSLSLELRSCCSVASSAPLSFDWVKAQHSMNLEQIDISVFIESFSFYLLLTNQSLMEKFIHINSFMWPNDSKQRNSIIFENSQTK